MRAISFIKQYAATFILLGAITAMSSILWTSDVATSKEDLATTEFGFPLPFIFVDQSRHEPPFPAVIVYCSPLGCPQTISWMAFAIDTLFFGSIFAALLFAGFSLFPAAWPYAQFLRFRYMFSVAVFVVVGTVAAFLILIYTSEPIIVHEVDSSIERTISE